MFQQVHGTAMGSPVSVVIANMVMESVKERILTTFDEPPAFWNRYVDDVCCVMTSDWFHHHVNKIEPCIQFILEVDKEGHLPFLDVLMKRRAMVQF